MTLKFRSLIIAFLFIKSNLLFSTENTDLYAHIQNSFGSYECLFLDETYLNETKKLLQIILPADQKYNHSLDLFPNKTGRNSIRLDESLEVWIKPRAAEFFLWEFSGLLGLSSYFPPAVPFFHFGRICSLQKHYSTLNRGVWFLDNPAHWKSVSLEDYWKGNLATFIFGMEDLHGSNIGTTPDGGLYFFDLECVFVQGKPSITPTCFGKYKSISASFASITFNWAQFKKPLNSTQAAQISAFIDSVSQKLAFLESLSIDSLMENVLILNSAYTTLSQEHVQALLVSMREKIDLLQEIQIKEGDSFKDLYFQLFPLLKEHQKKIEAFGIKLWGREGFGNAIWGLQRLIHIMWKQMNPQHLNSLTEWVNSQFGS